MFGLASLRGSGVGGTQVFNGAVLTAGYFLPRGGSFGNVVGAPCRQTRGALM